MPASVQLVLKSDGMEVIVEFQDVNSMLQGHMPGEGAERTHLEMETPSCLKQGLGMFTCKASGTLRGLKVFLRPRGASAAGHRTDLRPGAVPGASHSRL